MRLPLGVLVVSAVFAGMPGAWAQYYPPGYYPPPPGYYAPPPRRVLGGRCDARLPTAYGPRRLICDIVRAKPLGRPCACPPPRPPPGYAPGPFVGGRVIP